MKVLYFAYGSNMSSKRLCSRIASVKVVGRAFLEDRKMVFTKRSRDGSGKANLVESPGDVTWGVLYEMRNSDLDTLDRVEAGYQRITVQAQQPGGTGVEAVTYTSGNLTNDPRPRGWYKELLLSGAREHNLPQGYVSRLERFPVKSDNDAETAG